MAARLTDKQKKKIIADYVQLGSYNATAKVNGVSLNTVKKIVQENADIAEKCNQKKEENAADILAYMESQRSTVCEIIGKGLTALNSPEKLAEAAPAQITTALGTLIDKWAMMGNTLESRTKRGSSPASDLLLKNLGPAFLQLAQDAMLHQHTHYDLSGGRGSLKSSCVSLLVPSLIVNNPGTHALVLRKVANTIRDSVYAQYIWAIGALGMADLWEAKVAPMELIYKATGQKILFRGADAPMKIKSVKVPFGYIAITHFEEKDQFAGRAEIRTILQSAMRGGSVFWNFESYNPPISRDNWANKDSLEDRADRLCHKSTYLDAPPEWLGDQFIIEAEHLKATDERAYQHEYLGIPVGTGGNVFENLELREITDEEIRHFDRIYQGVDWGWFPDPFAFIRLHYDRARATIYLIDEIYQNKLANEDSAKIITARGYRDAVITCDGAEPKSVADYRAMGLPAKEAIKGPGSVDYGMKWLQKQTIVIDRKRTPNAYKEFVDYEYERNKDDEIISGYPDKDNHLIDATRYALERVYRKMGVTA